MEAIVYTSNAGHTKAYAELLGQETGLPVFALASAGRALPQGAEILYLGWLMAGTVKGYGKAEKQFSVRAVGAVGMTADDAQKADVRKVNRLEEDMPLFLLQGGFEMEKLHGVYKFMMQSMKKTAGKQLAEKPDRTPGETEMLDLLCSGGNRVAKENLNELLRWYESGEN